MHVELQRYLQKEKIARNDAASYIGNQLIRQRLANESIMKFVDGFIPSNGIVLDTCAGPEGSYLAAMRRGYRWVGNDISKRFSETLNQTGANVTLSDFCNAPFRDSSADATLFILALNNICSPEAALSQAKRVTKKGGIIVEAEPGLSSWSGKIIFHSLLSENSRLQAKCNIQYKNYDRIINDQFQDKPYTEKEYVDLLLKNALYSTRQTMLEDLDSIFASSHGSKVERTKVFFRFQQHILHQYFE